MPETISTGEHNHSWIRELPSPLYERRKERLILTLLSGAGRFTSRLYGG